MRFRCDKYDQWRWQHRARVRAQNYMKLFVAHKMTRNNTLNKVHVAVTELPQLLSQNTNRFGEATAFAAPKLTEEIKLLELKGGTCY